MPFLNQVRIAPPWASRRYKLFISHAWDYKGEYEALVSLLNSDSSFVWDNLSVPEGAPLSVLALLPKSYRYLVRQLDARISSVDCLLVLAGMYANHRGWIQSEIEAAQDFRKPIVAVRPRGNERLPASAISCAHETVGWNTASIVAAVHRHAGTPLVPQATRPIFPPPV